MSSSTSRPAPAPVAGGPVKATRRKSLKEQEAREEHARDVQALAEGRLAQDAADVAKAQAAGPSTDADRGLASFVGKAKIKKKEEKRRGLTTQDVDDESQRSQKAIADYTERANAAIEKLRAGLEFVAPHDEFEVSKELQNSSLDQYLHRQRQKFYTERNKRLFKSNLDAAERQHLFDEDFDSMKPEDTELELKTTEQEMHDIGRKLGIIKPSGGWNRPCECDAKLEHIKIQVKLHERKLTKVKMVRSFLNQVNHMALVIDEAKEEFAEREQQRLQDLLDAREKHFVLLQQVTNQKQQLDRLKRAGGGGKSSKDDADDAAAAAEAQQLETMRRQLAADSRKIGGGRGGHHHGRGGGGIALGKYRKAIEINAANEARLMASLDFDGHEDQAMAEYLAMRKKAQATSVAAMQSMNDDEFFATYGKYPSGQVGFKAGGSGGGNMLAAYAGGGASAAGTRGASGGGYQELQRLSRPAAAPTVTSEGCGALWTPDTRLIEAGVLELTKHMATAFDDLEQARSRVLAQVAAVAKSDEDACDELSGAFAVSSSAARDAMRRAGDSANATVKRISLAAQDALKRAASGGKKKAGEEGGNMAGLIDSLQNQVKNVAAERDEQRAQVRMLQQQLSNVGNPSSPAGSPTSFSEYVDDTRAGKKPAGGKGKAGAAATKPVKAEKKAGVAGPTSKKAAAPPAATKASTVKKGGRTASPSSAQAPPETGPVAEPTPTPVAAGVAFVTEDPEISSASVAPTAEDDDGRWAGADDDTAAPAATAPVMGTQHSKVFIDPDGFTGDQVETMRQHLIALARKLSECEVIDFGQGVAVDIELADGPEGLLSCTRDFAAAAERALTQRDTMVAADVTAALARTQKAVGMLLTNLQLAGLRFDEDTVERLSAPSQRTLERTTSSFAIEDLRFLEKGLQKCALGAREATDVFAKKIEGPLQDIIAGVVKGAREMLPHLATSLRATVEAAYRRGTQLESVADVSIRVNESFRRGADERGGVGEDGGRRLSSVTRSAGSGTFAATVTDANASSGSATPPPLVVAESSTRRRKSVAIVDPDDDAVADEPTPEDFTLKLPSDFDKVLDDGALESKAAMRDAAFALSLVLPALVNPIDRSQRVALSAIEQLDDARQDTVNAFEESQRRLRIYEPPTDSDDDGDAMTFFERRAVQERDRLAAELEERQEELRVRVAAAQAHELETKDLSDQLDLARREMRAADDAGKARLAHQQQVLIQRLLEATLAAEVAQRRKLEEAHAIGFVPVAQAFAVAFVDLQSPARVDAEAMTVEVRMMDAEMVTDPAPVVDIADACCGAQPQTADHDTSLSGMPTPEAAPLSPSREVQTMPVLQETLGVATDPAPAVVDSRAGPSGAPTPVPSRSGARADVVALTDASTSRTPAVEPLKRESSAPVAAAPANEHAATQTVHSGPVAVVDAASSPMPRQAFAAGQPHPADDVDDSATSGLQDRRAEHDGDAKTPQRKRSVKPSKGGGASPTKTLTKGGRAAKSTSSKPDAKSLAASAAAAVSTPVATPLMGTSPHDDDAADDDAHAALSTVKTPTVPEDATPVAAEVASSARQHDVLPTSALGSEAELPQAALPTPRSREETTFGERPPSGNGGAAPPRAPGMAVTPASPAVPEQHHVSDTATSSKLPPPPAPSSVAEVETASKGLAAPAALVSAASSLLAGLGLPPATSPADTVTVDDVAASLSQAAAALANETVASKPGTAGTAPVSSHASSSSKPPTAPIASIRRRDSKEEQQLVSESGSHLLGGSRLGSAADAMMQAAGQPASVLRTPGSSRRAKRVNIADQHQRLPTPVADARHLTPSDPTPALVPPPGASDVLASPSHQAAQQRPAPEAAAAAPIVASSSTTPPQPAASTTATTTTTTTTVTRTTSNVAAAVSASAPTPLAAATAAAPSAATIHEFFAGPGDQGVNGGGDFERLVTPAHGERPATFGGPPSAEGTLGSAAGQQHLAHLLNLERELAARHPATLATDATAAHAPPFAGSGSAAAAAGAPAAAAAVVVDLEPVLEVCALMGDTLTELFKRLDTKRRGEVFDDPFTNGLATPTLETVVQHMHGMLSSVHRLLHTDSRLARRGMTKAIEQAAMRARISGLQRLRSEKEVADTPQAAAFLDRQEEKLRKAEAKLASVREQIAAERDKAFTSFFLPTSDVAHASVSPGLLPRRRGPVVVLPGAPAVESNRAPAVAHGTTAHAHGRPFAPTPTGRSLAATLSSVPLGGAQRAPGHGPDGNYARSLLARAREGAGTPPPATEDTHGPPARPTASTPGPARKLPPMPGGHPAPLLPQPADPMSPDQAGQDSANLVGSPVQWLSPPAGAGAARARQHQLNAVRVPHQQRIKRPAHSHTRAFQPDAALFASPLQGQRSQIADRKPSPTRAL